MCVAHSFSGRYCHATGKSKRINPCSELTPFIFLSFYSLSLSLGRITRPVPVGENDEEGA
jgi:hypothetical protein